MTQSDDDDPTMTIQVNIRPPQPTDAAALARLSAEMGYEVTPGELAGRLRRVQAHRGHDVLVAETPDGTVVGWIHVFTAPRIESAGFVEIGGLVVDGRFRRRGIGARLVAAAEEAARRHGFGAVRVRSRIERGEAHQFYEARGFQPVKTQRVYEKLVPENRAATVKE